MPALPPASSTSALSFAHQKSDLGYRTAAYGSDYDGRGPAKIPLKVAYYRTKLIFEPGDEAEAMVAADSGTLLPAAQLVEGMLGDGIISGITQSQAAGLTRLPLTFDGAEELVYKLAGRPDMRTDGIFWKMFPSAVLIRIIIWGILFGAGFGEFVECPKTGLPVLHFVEPQHIAWRRDPVTRQQILYIVAEDKEHIITPGDGRWFVFAPWGIIRFWLHGKWRPCGKAWLDKVQAQEQRTVAGARHALGITWLETPEGRSRDEDANAIVTHITSSPTPPVMALEKGYDIKHTSISGEGYQQWTATKQESDADIATALSGQTVTSGQTGTGWSKGDIHENTNQSFIEEYADALSEAVQRDGLDPWAEREGYPCPKAEWDPTPPGDRKAIGDALGAYGDGLAKADASLAGRGKRVKAEPLARMAGVELEDVASAEEPTMVVDGLPVVIEYPAGSIRTGTDERGVPWAVSMGSVSYGYIPGTGADDGEPIDVYVGPTRGRKNLFVMKQLDHEGNPDEVKLFVGFHDLQAAQDAWDRLVGRPELVGGWREVDLSVVLGIVGASNGVAGISEQSTAASAAGDKPQVFAYHIEADALPMWRIVESLGLPRDPRMGEMYPSEWKAFVLAEAAKLGPVDGDDVSEIEAEQPTQSENGTAVSSTSAESEPTTDEKILEAIALAEQMTAHQVERCEHNCPNKCWLCGIERVRRLIPGSKGKPHRWAIAWKAIGQTAKVAGQTNNAPQAIASMDRSRVAARKRSSYPGIDWSVPEGAREAFARGVELAAQGFKGDGLQDDTIAAARELSKPGAEFTPDKIVDMVAWFERHESDRKEGWHNPPTPGYVAWLVWGGDPGRRVAKRLRARMLDIESESENGDG